MSSKESKQFDLRMIFELLICIYYAWYFLPICNAWLDGSVYKAIFFACFATGCVGLVILNKFRINSVVAAVGLYMFVFLFLFLANVGDIDKHIRVSFTFWGTALLYFGILDNGGKLRLGKFLLVLFGITSITSAIGVLINNAAARTIAHAGAGDALHKAYKMMNISSIYLFQCLIYFVPILICIPKESRKQKWGSIITIIGILVTLLNASFTIALIVFIFAVILSIYLKGTSIKKIISMVVIGGAAVLFLLYGGDALYSVSEIIDNERIALRLKELAVAISTGVLDGGAELRWDLYASSATTFLENPFGIGAHYSYIRFENGIGYHSQLLDDLARYGVAAIAFYMMFLSGYYRQLKMEWKQIGCPYIASAVVTIYIIFLILNLGFRSADESIVMLFILPVLPKLIYQYQKKHFEKIERKGTN